MAKLSKSSTLELEKSLITILKDLTGEEVKPESKLDDFSITLDSMDVSDLCMSLERLGYDYEKSFNICMDHMDVTVAELALHLSLCE